MKPTNEQVRTFWEWYGFKNLVYGQGVWEYRWFYIDDRGQRKELPPIDLNSLFKWAVPKLDGCSLYYYKSDDNWRAGVGYNREERGEEYYDKDPALALFWAIWEVIQQENMIQ